MTVSLADGRATILIKTLSLLLVSFLGGLAASGCGRPPAEDGRQVRVSRWVWDTVAVWTSRASARVDTVLAPGAEVSVGQPEGDVRPVFVRDSMIGFVPDTLLQHTPLPTHQNAYQMATAAAAAQLALPHTVVFPPLDSAEVVHRGRGVFVVRAALSAEDGAGVRRQVPWAVWMHRLRYRWAVDSVQVGDGSD